MKKIRAWIAVVALALSMAGLGLANGLIYAGTVTKISGNKVTVQNESGQLNTIIVSGRVAFKVGDKVSVADGKITLKESGDPHVTPQTPASRTP